MIAIIVAKAANNVIGKDNQLIWHLPKDLKYFKELTTGNIIVMGRKTLESLPFKLPNREHWVLTRQADYVPPYEGVRVFTSVDELLEATKSVETVYCIGGAEIYKALMPYADILYVTESDQDFDGDAVFPNIDQTKFTITRNEDGGTDEKNPLPFRFVTYERNK